jgi:hypothetical protein
MNFVYDGNGNFCQHSTNHPETRFEAFVWLDWWPLAAAVCVVCVQFCVWSFVCVCVACVCVSVWVSECVLCVS